MENTQNDTERVNELNYKAGYADGLLMAYKLVKAEWKKAEQEYSKACFEDEEDESRN